MGAARATDKGIRQWQPSALSPLPKTAFPAPSRPSTSTSRQRSSGSTAPPKTLPTSGSWPAMSSSAQAGRNRRAKPKRDYISVKLDDPSFPAPIYATLTEVQGQEGSAAHLVTHHAPIAPKEEPRCAGGAFLLSLVQRVLERFRRREGQFFRGGHFDVGPGRRIAHILPPAVSPAWSFPLRPCCLPPHRFVS